MEVGRQILFAELRPQIGKVLTYFFPAFSITQRSSASAKVSKRQERFSNDGISTSEATWLSSSAI
jgi:hypothetical protein